MNFPRTSIAIGVVFVACAGPGIARAQHTFDVIVQQAGGQLVTAGCCNGGGQWALGKRVFTGEFPSEWATNNPGYGAFGTGSPNLPAGSQPPPGSTALNWDFLPMTIKEMSQNLFYWNGQDSDSVPGLTANDVEFGQLPGANYTLSQFDKTNAKFSTDGTNSMVAGGDIGETNADGSLHFHRYFFLEDNDGNSATSPADGIYLIAQRYRMSGAANSDPVFIVFGTPNSSVQALDDAAIPWIEQQLNLPGDYNRNGVVDAADYALWRDTLNKTGAGLSADGSGNHVVDQADYNLWRIHFGDAAELIVVGGSGASVAGLGAVPEGSTLGMALVALVIVSGVACSRRAAT